MLAPISDKKAFVTELLSRLRIRIEYTRESEKDFAKRLGSSEALFKNLSNGSLPSADRLTVLLKEIGDRLILGSDTDHKGPAPFVVDGADYTPIPLHQAVLSAGPGATNGDSAIIDHLAFRQDWLAKVGLAAKDAAMARVSGDSMAPGLKDGDLVMIDTTRREVPVRKRSRDDLRKAPIYAFVHEGEARVKRIERPEPGRFLLISDNADFAPELVNADSTPHFNILGQVVWSGHNWR